MMSEVSAGSGEFGSTMGTDFALVDLYGHWATPMDGLS